MYKTEKNKKLTKEKLEQLKKKTKGITLIALVVTIIVLLILAGVAINLSIGQNGIFSRAKDATSTWRNAEANEQLTMGELVDKIDKVTRVDGVPIPEGFYYAGGSKETGLVISDKEEDEKNFSEESKNEEVDNTLQGNQFVWVPVPDYSSLYVEEKTAIKLSNVNATTNIWSNLNIRSVDESTFKLGKPGETEKSREPDVLNSYDTDGQYYKTILGFNSTKEMANNFVEEYNAIYNSIKKFEGFYIGRYELTGTVNNPSERKGEVLSADKAGNWYYLYKACKNMIKKENVKSTMIYGVQWDATMEWLKQTKFKDDTGKVDTDSTSWGNCNDSSGDADIEEAGTKQDTGYSEFWKANNIYDLAGNCFEWTQEAGKNSNRVLRGGSFDNSGSLCPVSDRTNNIPSSNIGNATTRAILYIK